MLNIQPGITAIIGAGGKSTLLRALAEELSAHARVVVATSTKMHVPDWCPVVLEGEGAEGGEGCEGCEGEGVEGGEGASSTLRAAQAALDAYPRVCVGSIHRQTGKLQASHLEFSRLAEVAGYVLVEADGAHRLPLKAHAAHEPVIPAGASRVVCVAGADGFGAPVSQVCHRPERFAELAGVSVDATVTPEAVAAVLNAEALADVVLVNKVETPAAWAAAERLAALLNTPTVAGSLWRGELRCL